MLRITPLHERPGRTTVRLEGRLGGSSVAELDGLCAPLLARCVELRLDLRGLAFVDPAGIDCLCRLLARGARAEGGSPFVAELLKECPP